MYTDVRVEIAWSSPVSIRPQESEIEELSNII